jgi:hypothetical protein
VNPSSSETSAASMRRRAGGNTGSKRRLIVQEDSSVRSARQRQGLRHWDSQFRDNRRSLTMGCEAKSTWRGWRSRAEPLCRARFTSRRERPRGLLLGRLSRSHRRCSQSI